MRIEEAQEHCRQLGMHRGCRPYREPENPVLPYPVNMSSKDRLDVPGGMEKRLLAKYPLHICLMVKAAAKALDEGRAEIRDGVLVIRPTEDRSQKGLDS